MRADVASVLVSKPLPPVEAPYYRRLTAFRGTTQEKSTFAMATAEVSTGHILSSLDARHRAEASVRPMPTATNTASPNSRPTAPAQHARRILVCLDRSTLSEVCVPHAISLAKTFDSAVTLAHIMQPHHDILGPPTNDALGWEISRQEAQAYLERLQKEVSQALGRPVDIRLEQGRPAQRLVDLAREVSADLTILGSRGEGGAAAQALGSTVLQVLAAARGSLFIAHPSSNAAAEAIPTRILVPLDGSLRSESVLPAATRIASAYRAELILVHVVQEPLTTAILPVADEVPLAQKLTRLLDAGAERYLQGLQHHLEQEVTSVRTLVIRHASAPQCLLEVSQKEKVDLIVLSAHGSACNASRSFGSVTACLLTHTPVPLLTLQDIQESELHDTRITDASLAPPSPRASYAAGSE